jgi:hypothetical protein
VPSFCNGLKFGCYNLIKSEKESGNKLENSTRKQIKRRKSEPRLGNKVEIKEKQKERNQPNVSFQEVNRLKEETIVTNKFGNWEGKQEINEPDETSKLFEDEEECHNKNLSRETISKQGLDKLSLKAGIHLAICIKSQLDS